MNTKFSLYSKSSSSGSRQDRWEGSWNSKRQSLGASTGRGKISWLGRARAREVRLWRNVFNICHVYGANCCWKKIVYCGSLALAPSWPYDDIVEASERRVENLLRENFTVFPSLSKKKYYDNFMGCFICCAREMCEMNSTTCQHHNSFFFCCCRVDFKVVNVTSGTFAFFPAREIKNSQKNCSFAEWSRLSGMTTTSLGVYYSTATSAQHTKQDSSTLFLPSFPFHFSFVYQPPRAAHTTPKQQTHPKQLQLLLFVVWILILSTSHSLAWNKQEFDIICSFLSYTFFHCFTTYPYSSTDDDCQAWLIRKF